MKASSVLFDVFSQNFNLSQLPTTFSQARCVWVFVCALSKYWEKFNSFYFPAYTFPRILSSPASSLCAFWELFISQKIAAKEIAVCLCECVCYNKELMVKGNSRKENLFCLIIIVVICAVDFHKFSFQHFISVDGVETIWRVEYGDADKRHLATLLSIIIIPLVPPPHSYHSHLRRSIFSVIFLFSLFTFSSFSSDVGRGELRKWWIIKLCTNWVQTIENFLYSTNDAGLRGGTGNKGKQKRNENYKLHNN